MSTNRMQSMQVLNSLRQAGLAAVFAPAKPDGEPDAHRQAEHHFSGHTPLWAYALPSLATPFADQGRPPIFEVLDPGLPVEDVVKRTNLLVFVGAARSRALALALARQDACKLVFEPDPVRLAAFAEDLGPAALAQSNCFLFGGDVHQARPPLSRTLELLLRKAGYPVFLVQQGLERSHPDFLERLFQCLEINFYRHRIYTMEGQWLARSKPVRDIARGLFYDQQKHLYENLTDLASWPDISAVKDAFPGATAILVAAGPDLPHRLDWIRDNTGRALVIAISRTAAELAEAGISPHFTVINDNSEDAEQPLACLPDMGRTILAAHCLSPLGKAAFRRKVLFGTVLPNLLGQRPMLRLHGSVITTAFSLACWLGCKRAVLVGAQMASDDPWTFSYSAHSAVGRPQKTAHGRRHLIHRHPQYVPLKAASGRTMYTSLNFLDATHWLLDDIRESGLEVVNTSADSIIHGPNVAVDEDYRVPEGLDADTAFDALTLPALDLDPGPLNSYLRSEQDNWRNTAKAVDNVLAKLASPGGLAAAGRLIEIFDANNTTYLTHRFNDFSNARFHALYFQGKGDAERRRGAAYLLDHVRNMAREFLDILGRSQARLKGYGKGA